MNHLRETLAVLMVGLALPCLAETAFTTVSLNLGGPDYLPAPGDYDGDGKLDPAVYREASGDWYVGLSSNQYAVESVNLGGAGFEPVAEDYDGDGRADPAVYQETTGNWYARLSGSGYNVSWLPSFGQPGCAPVPGDYDGNGLAEMAVYQISSGNWYLLRGEEVEVTDTNQLAIMYSNAMVNAANVVASKIRKDLASISEDNAGLIWRTNAVTGAREVLMASFMRAGIATNSFHVGHPTIMRYGDSWLTAVPELKNFCGSYAGTNMLLRMKQLLGLPLTSANDMIVEFYVDPSCLLRPSRDPEITDHEAEVAFRANTPYAGAVATNFTGWFQRTIISRNYGMTNGVWNAYPWGQLGYTYDWSRTGNNVMGLSEFVLPGQMLYDEYKMTAMVYVVTVTNALDYATSADNHYLPPQGLKVYTAPPDAF